jgi:DNA-binding NtrC family response regulator
MNTPVVALLPSTLGEVKKKRVLLVDASHSKRDLRAEVMRKLGIDVDCACDIAEARSWWRADLYDLVLINMEKGLGHRDRFCEDIRGATPPQRLAFLVGEPEYLGEAPNAEDELLIDNTADPFQVGHVKAALSANVGDLSQRWGILEASRRISAVRSACSARSRAMQDRPVPLRDSEGRPSKKTAASIVLENLLRGEMQ